MKDDSSLLTARSIMIVSMIIELYCFFHPVFHVFKSHGSFLEVSLLDLAVGWDYYDEMMIMWVNLMLPIISLLFLFTKPDKAKDVGAPLLVSTVINLLLWGFYYSYPGIIFSEYSDETVYHFSAWSVVNVLSLIMAAVLSMLILSGKIQLDDNVMTFLSGGKAGVSSGCSQTSAEWMPETVPTPQEHPGRTAQKVRQVIVINAVLHA